MAKTGKTTRVVDRAIQNLFNTGKAYLYDGRSKDVSTHTRAIAVFSKRMSSEHPSAKYTYEFNFWDGVWCYKIEIHDL